MSTKTQMLDTIIRLETQIRRMTLEMDELKECNKSLTLAVQSSLPELEHAREGAYPAERHNVWSRNEKPKDAARAQFVALKEWAGRNIGYGDDDEEKQATGLGCLVYLRDAEPSFAIRFAAEVCEQHNYHGECAMLMRLYDQVTQPYAKWPADKQVVNWWAD